MPAASYTRVYQRGGAIAHLREDVAPAGHILCSLPGPRGGRPKLQYSAAWRGTGSQDEAERAAALPLCPGCAAAAGI